MTTNNPPVAVPPQRRGAGPGRVLAIIASVFLLFISVCLALAGTALMVTFGNDGEVTSAKQPVTSPTAAVITDVAAIRDTSEVADALGTPVVNLAADGGNSSGLFLGIGRVADVDRYLSGVEVDQAVDFELDPYSLTLARRDGAEPTAPPPTQQDFWVASATGSNGLDLNWAVQDGNYRVVLMNADGSAGVDSQLSVGVGLGGMFGLSLGLLIGGGVLILLAIALLVVTRPRPLPAPSGPPDPRYAPPAGTSPSGPAPSGAALPGQAPSGQAPSGQAQSGQAPTATPAAPIEPSPPVREPRT